MERQNNTKAQQNIKYRLLACVVAVALAIGLSAMPALAEPSEEQVIVSISVGRTPQRTLKPKRLMLRRAESGTSDSSEQG